MNKYRILMYITMSVLMTVSCDSDKNIEIEKVNDSNVKVKEIVIKELNLDVQPLVPVSLCFVDTFLVICENEGKLKTNFISIYSNDKLVKKFGRIGDGPTDMAVPMYLSEGKCEKKYLTIGSASSIMKFDIEYFIYNDSLTCITENVPNEIRLCNSLLYNSDTLAISSCTGENTLSFYDKRKRIIEGYSFFDKDFFSNRKVTKFIYNMQVFPAVCGYNNGNILIAYTMQKSLDVVSVNGELKKRIRFNNYDHNKTKMRTDNSGNLINVLYDEDAIYYFCSSCVTDDAFFVISQEEYRPPHSRSIIYKFDWNGNLLMKYYCDKIITDLVVNNDKIYSIAKCDDGEYEISYAEL